MERNKIKISAHNYSVDFLAQHLVDSDYNGTIDNTKLEIRIATLSADNKKRPLSVVKETLYHEVIHGISHIYNLGLEEAIVDSLAQGLTEVAPHVEDILKCYQIDAQRALNEV